MTVKCRGIAFDTEEQDKESTRISEYLHRFDNNHRFYFAAFVLSEFIQCTLIIATFAYYLILFSAYKSKVVEVLAIISSHYKYHRFRNDSTLQVFPREVVCTREWTGASGTVEHFNYVCKIHQNEHNENLHIIAFMVSTAILVLYYFNVFYIAFTFNMVHSSVPTAKQRYVWSKLSNKKNLFLFWYVTILMH